jgi:hypothetical protein
MRRLTDSIFASMKRYLFHCLKTGVGNGSVISVQLPEEVLQDPLKIILQKAMMASIG